MATKINGNNWATVECISEAKELLCQDNYKKVLKEYRLIDYLSKLEKFPIQSPTLNWLLPRGESEYNDNPNKRTIKFTISRYSYTFGLVEFALVTGLPFGDYPNFDLEAETPFRTFLDTNRLRFSDLCAKLHLEKQRNGSSIEMCKLVMLFIVHKMVFVRAYGIIVPKAICLADNPVLFNSYPWDRVIYEEVIMEWAHMFNRSRGPGVKSMNVGTFPFAIQAWFLEFCFLTLLLP